MASGEFADLQTGEQRALERRQVVQHSLRRRLLYLRVVDQGTKGLLLQGTEEHIQLITAEGVRVRGATDWSGPGPLKATFFYRRNAAPDIDRGLGRGEIGGGINEADIWWLGRRRCERDRCCRRLLKSLCLVTVDPEVVCVDRPKQWIVGIPIEEAQQLQHAVAILHVSR